MRRTLFVGQADPDKATSRQDVRLQLLAGQTDTRAFSAGRREKFDTGGFKRVSHGKHRADTGIANSSLQPFHCGQRNDSLVGQFLLAPTDECSCSTDLARGNHGAISCRDQPLRDSQTTHLLHL